MVILSGFFTKFFIFIFIKYTKGENLYSRNVWFLSENITSTLLLKYFNQVIRLDFGLEVKCLTHFKKYIFLEVVNKDYSSILISVCYFVINSEIDWVKVVYTVCF